MSAENLKPYRVEHKHADMAQWLLVDEAETHDEALELAEAFPKAHKGFKTRVVAQHVIERRP